MLWHLRGSLLRVAIAIFGLKFRENLPISQLWSAAWQLGRSATVAIVRQAVTGSASLPVRDSHCFDLISDKTTPLALSLVNTARNQHDCKTQPGEPLCDASMSLKPPSFQPQPASDHNLDDDLDLTIRFSASLPDLLLSIPGSLNANTATLKQLIRSRIPDEHSKHRIRLIYAGKALVDDVPLNVSLKRNVSRPPSRIGTPGPYDASDANGAAAPGGTAQGQLSKENGKGKLPLRDPKTQSRIYIHCSIGDIVLTPSELAAEAVSAQNANSTDPDKPSQPTPVQTTTTPAPRGFDRLANAGFSASEVQSLRLQFLAIQAHTHTPDTMPSPNTLRNMEDRWLDNSSSADDAGTLGAGAGGGAGVAEDEAAAGALDDMIWGTAMGFFWPIGCMLWGIREEGIWSQRRKMAVVVGFVLNVGLGIVRYTG